MSVGRGVCPARGSVVGSVVVLLTMVMAACDSGDGVHVTPRTPDGLLTDTALQAVVELQVARDLYGLVDRLSDSRAAVRARAAFGIATLRSPQAVDALLRLLADPAAEVRLDAAFALGQIRDPVAVAPLAALLDSESDDAVRAEAYRALGRMAADRAADALLALSVPRGEIAEQTAALASLAGFYGVRHLGARDVLTERLSDPDPAVRVAAAEFFSRPRGAALWAGRAVLLRGALDAYALDDPAAIHLVRALGMIQDFLDTPRLQRWAEEATDWRTRAAAMATLDPNSSSARIILNGLDSDVPSVAAAAASTFGDDAIDENVARAAQEWVAAHPRRLTIVAPILAQAAEAQQAEVVLAWTAQIEPGDESAWAIGFDVLSYLGGEEVILRLVAALDDPSDRVAGRAMEAISGRWAFDAAAPATRDLYYRLFSEALAHPRAEVGEWARRELSGPIFEAWVTRDGLALSVSTDSEAGGAAVSPLLPDARVIDWAFLASLGQAPHLEIETTRGSIRVRLLPESAPLTVQTVARLAEQGAYDGVPFHRVIATFMVQSGDVAARDGTGDPGFSIRTEVTHIGFRRGVIGMAHLGQRDTENTQFFITQSSQPHLDIDYTAFGWTVDGMDVVDRIERGDLVLRARIVATR